MLAIHKINNNNCQDDDKAMQSHMKASAKGIYGETTRELRSAWTRRMLNDTSGEAATKSPVEPKTQLQALFNDLQLFPSQSQLFEMVQCARECTMRGRHTSDDEVDDAKQVDDHRGVKRPLGNGSLTFGEFCMFATELRKYYNCQYKSETGAGAGRRCNSFSLGDKCGSGACTASSGSGSGISNSSSNRSDNNSNHFRTQRSSVSAYDVFLGGSCNPTTWRQDVAIPHLKSQGITYYNPQQSNWVPEMIELEHQAKQTSQILFFVMNELTRNVASMIEVAYMAGANRRLIVVIQPFPGPGHCINGVAMTENEFQDLSNGLTTVHDLVERRGLPVFRDINVALNCTTKVLKEDVPIEELGLDDHAHPVKLAHVQIGDKLVRLREAFDALDTNRAGMISLADIRMAFRIHTHRDLSHSDLRQIIEAHDPTFVTPKSKSTKKKASSSLPLDLVMIDFDQFCCIVSEFKHKNQQHHQKTRKLKSEHPETSSSSSSLSFAPGTLSSTGPEKKFSHFFHNVLHPFHRLSSKCSGRSKHLPRRTKSAAQIPKRVERLRRPSPPKRQRRGSQIRDVYLGGSMTGEWREAEAIPMLKKHGFTFFRPTANRRLIPLEAASMDNSRVLLFVISGSCRSVSAMCEAAYCIGRGATVVLCVKKIPENGVLEGETQELSKCAIKDYNRGRAYLSDIANREGVPVFEEVQEAIDCVLQKCKNLK